jgi:hypothetical protein
MADTAMKKGMNEFLTAYTALWVDLPFAGLRMGLGMSDEKEATEAAWKSYDAAVKLTTTAIDDLYRNPLVGELTASALDGMLRWQKAGNALSGAFFTGMWRAVGLPTAAEIQALREEVRALAEKSQPVELQVKPKIRQVKPAAKASEVIQLHSKVA